MRKKLGIALVAMLFLVIVQCLTSVVYAPSGRYQVNVLIAYDEEWADCAWWVYGYTAETLARILFYSATYHFWYYHRIDFKIKGYTSWDSNDSPANADAMMDEMINEVGFTSGMTWGGPTVHVLVGLTDQGIPDCYGYADNVLGVILCEEYYTTAGGQHTDNIMQHELSHLYECGHHYEDGLECVMNTYPYWLDLPDWIYIPWGLTTDYWCSDCWNTIKNNRGAWGWFIAGTSYGGGGGGGGFIHLCAW